MSIIITFITFINMFLSHGVVYVSRIKRNAFASAMKALGIADSEGEATRHIS